MEKPTKPSGKCFVCGSEDWWWRPASGLGGPGGWLCGKCHPNPNPGSGSNSEGGKLAPGMVVISDQPGESHPVPVSSGKKAYSPEVLALRDRVILGNDKLFRAWLQIRELVDDKEEWARFGEATKKLRELCIELRYHYSDCLYLNEDGKRTRSCLSNPDDFWCQVCPSSRKYSEEELMALPGPKAYSVKQEEEGQTEFLKTLGGKG